tara:strand:+ start:5913 stop:6239 length:327 start_codon:yes stop_codon:yes gene_type:complete
MNQNNRKVILCLYRSKLKLSHNFGYQYGKWDNNKLIINQINNKKFINKKKIKKKYGSQELGSYIMNNVRYRYKMCKYENDKIEIDSLINYAFECYRELTYLCNGYIRK